MGVWGVKLWVAGVSSLVVFCFAGAPSALAEGFCAFGSSAGQCKSPAGVAVNRVSGEVFVADSENNRINVFDSDGLFLFSFGGPGSGVGQFFNPRKIAIDNNPASPNFQDVYVADSSQRIQRFSPAGAFEAVLGGGQLNRNNTPISVSPTGMVYAVDSVGSGAESENRQVKIFSPAGLLVGSATIGVGAFGDAVVDSTSNLYIIRVGANGRIEKYGLTEPSASLLETFDTNANTTALAVDDEDNLYAAQLDASSRVITKRNSSGTVVKRFGYGDIQFNLEGLAVDADGALFGSEAYVGSETLGNKVVRIPQPLRPFAVLVSINPGNTKATLEGQINPEGKSTSYHFDYITDTDFVANGNSFSGPSPATSTPESAPVGSDFNLHPAQAQIGCATPTDPPQPECLEPETTYHVRLVATDVDDVENASRETTFESKEPFEVTGTWSTDIGLSGAKIHASINPFGIPATAFFEYTSTTPPLKPPFSLTRSKRRVSRSTSPAEKVPLLLAPRLAGLAPSTLYHYRVVVANSFVEEAGPEATFITYPPSGPIPTCANDAFRVGPSALLANCRAYEMVSPVDKNGGDIEVLVQGVGFPARLSQTSDSSDAFTYSSVAAFANAQSALWSSQYLSRRGEGGWSTQSINQPKDAHESVREPDPEARCPVPALSPDLANGWLSQYANPQLDECAPQGFINLYRRDNTTGSYEALAINPPTNISSNPDYRLELQGVSIDGTRAVFRANAKLSPEAFGASGSNAYQLYIHIRDPKAAAASCGWSASNRTVIQATPARKRRRRVPLPVPRNIERVQCQGRFLPTAEGSFSPSAPPLLVRVPSTSASTPTSPRARSAPANARTRRWAARCRSRPRPHSSGLPPPTAPE